MSQADKIIGQFLACRGPFPYKGFIKVLMALGYEEVNRGKSSGSAMAFYNKKLDHLITQIHKPHPSKDMKAGAVKSVKEELKFAKAFESYEGK